MPRPPEPGLEPDDVDGVFAHLARAAVPDDLTARVLASTVARPKAVRTSLTWPWLAAGLAALALLSASGYQVGASLAATDGLAVLPALLGDANLLTTAPGDVLAALGELLPIPLLALASMSAAVLTWTAGKVGSRASGGAVG